MLGSFLPRDLSGFLAKNPATKQQVVMVIDQLVVISVIKFAIGLAFLRRIFSKCKK